MEMKKQKKIIGGMILVLAVTACASFFKSAAEEIAQEETSEIYQNEDFDDFVNQILTMMISECASEFEELPIIEDVDILRNILYSGVWAKFQSIRNKRKQVEEKTDD